MKDRDGKAVLVNIDRVTAVTFDEENGTSTVLTPEGTLTFCMGREELRRKVEDDTPERIAGNLFHIWEILRARLH